MKRKLLLILALVLLTACSKSSGPIKDGDSWNKIDEKVLATMLSGYDMDPLELKSLIEANMENMAEDDLSRALFALETSQRNSLSTYRELLDQYRVINSLSGLIYNEEIFQKEELHSIADDYARRTVRDILDAGYRINKKDEMIFLEVDYEGYEGYGDHLGQDLKKYLEISSLDRDLSFKDYRLLAKGLVDLEEKILSMEDPLYQDRVLRIYEENLINFLGGRYTEGILDDKGMYSDEILNIYTEIARGESISAKVSRSYLNYISGNEYVFKEENRGKILELCSLATSELESQWDQ